MCFQYNTIQYNTVRLLGTTMETSGKNKKNEGKHSKNQERLRSASNIRRGSGRGASPSEVLVVVLVALVVAF